MTYEEALNLVRLMIDHGISRDAAIDNPVIPIDFRARIREALTQDENITLRPARMFAETSQWYGWLNNIDRSNWYYWPRLREYLVRVKGWTLTEVRSLDDVTDRVLGLLAPPSTSRFDIRGLVLGYVQSGKTTNFTALIAKASDVGYRLIVVLSGTDNGLRRQTQIRLKRELVGYPDNRPSAVRFPPIGKQWHEFTSEEINGDFRSGHANQAALQGSQPVLLVIKKNGPVLRRLLQWIDEAPEAVRQTIPLLVIDDEADLASVDTRGTRQTEEDPLPDDYEQPSVINRLIRDLLRKFQRRAYVAYTATPFANILIPHDTFDPSVENDLYPKDFILDLPKPDRYFGAEELFGRFDPGTGGYTEGLDVIRDVPDEDLGSLEQGNMPASLEVAMMDFVLSGAAKRQRQQNDNPATMLIHVSYRIADQLRITELVIEKISELRDEWRYDRKHGIIERFQQRWDEEFRPLIRANNPQFDALFEQIQPFIGPFFEAIQVKTINSVTDEELDYQREPALKAIVIGGNRLSRGLTLEGLLISYFVRRSVMYDTLMQMGRWFGYRNDYEDLTRIYTTTELAEWFSDLAFVEHELREDLEIYENQGLTPRQVGMRIWQHPSMQVTSPLKRRFASAITISQSYSFSLEQTFKFPLRHLDDLSAQAEYNLQAVRRLFAGLGEPQWHDSGPVWVGVLVEHIVNFLQLYTVDDQIGSISLPLIQAYIKRQTEIGELVQWTVAVRGRQNRDNNLGEANWGINGGHIWQIGRTRIRDTNSVGVITSPGDEAIGLSADAKSHMDEYMQQGDKENRAARRARSPQEGLLLLYPISKYSGQNPEEQGGIRRPLFENPDDPMARDLIGLALSFPQSSQAQQVEAYLEGTVRWRPVE